MDEKAWSMVEALRARGELTVEGRAALAAAYPNAPSEMRNTAAFHLFTDGVPAVVAWLADLERFLRDPAKGLDYGATWHLLYHLYNWQQFEALVPLGGAGLSEQLADAQKFLVEGDT